ncbi:hypothetical protein [Bacterioplanoides sp.]|uniref:hypothetical protein n=1 Tax=Bacterioplanoides sp. TaxID=2066072 RepID=UPI003B5B3E53
MRITSLIAVSALLLISSFVYSDNNRSDFDIDNNGLIEIHDLKDLNEIRNNLNGRTLYGKNLGCPSSGCVGFELVSDLNFDNNQDGIFNSHDDYWNEGKGWLPIGSIAQPFTAEFHGNGHSLKNLVINRPGPTFFERLQLVTQGSPYTDQGSGLFGATKAAKVTNLRIEATITGDVHIGTIAGLASDTQFTNIAITSKLINTSYGGLLIPSTNIGGLIGEIRQGKIERVYINTRIDIKSGQAAGLVAILKDTQAENIYVAGSVSLSDSKAFAYEVENSTVNMALSTISGLEPLPANTMRSIYWRGGETDSGYDELSVLDQNYVGTSLEELTCARHADATKNNSDCLKTGDATLYAGWSSQHWDFGNSTQLPALKLFGGVLRDNDLDAVFDVEDEWPEKFAAAIDADKDGHPDFWTIGCNAVCQQQSGIAELDQFPQSALVWSDKDLDNKPELCDQACENNSGLQADDFPLDFDNDGIPDAEDSDSNGDGITDADSDSNGLIDIETLAELNAIRFQLGGHGQQLTENGAVNNSGCPVVLVDSRYLRRCNGYELKNNLSFDSNNDGVVNESDDYWNNGSGWQPVGNYDAPFIAEFNGNGFAITHLTVNRPSSNNASLFGVIENSAISDLQITEATISGLGESGILSGRASDSDMSDIILHGSLKARTDAGGAAGKSYTSQYRNLAVAIMVDGEYDLAGVVGESNSDNFSDITVSGHIKGIDELGGLMGEKNGSDYTRVLVSARVVNDNNEQQWQLPPNNIYPLYNFAVNYTGNYTNDYRYASADALRCPTAASTRKPACNKHDYNGTLYLNWPESLWDFAGSDKFPGLKVSGKIYRDNDGDGSFDNDDAWPDNAAYSVDKDSDGYPDDWNIHCDQDCRSTEGLLPLDRFPEDRRLWKDNDLDGLADECILDCENTSGLEIDLHPGDFDNDGVADLNDTDSDNDGIDDADADHNGLIDIYTIEQLHAVRHQLDGSGRKLSADTEADNSGCPFVPQSIPARRQCVGYELKADISMDTNGDGKITEADSFWNNGTGWQSIGSLAQPFTAVFRGNGFLIDQLYMDSPDTTNSGLFAAIEHSTDISNIKLKTSSKGMNSNGYLGVLAGTIKRSEVSDIVITGRLTAPKRVAGLAAHIEHTIVQNIFANISIYSSGESSQAAGILGYLYESELKNCFASGYINSANSGGLASYSIYSDVEHCLSTVYTDHAGIETSPVWSRRSHDNFYEDGVYFLDYKKTGFDYNPEDLLTVLRCPTQPDASALNSSCAIKNNRQLYKGWDNTVWDFGSKNQLPGLMINGQVYRDSDGDGVSDDQDDWPEVFASSIDSDKDTHPDKWTPGCNQSCVNQSALAEYDNFPNHSQVWQDSDLDGLPEQCDQACQDATGLALDEFPDDFDNDGIADPNDSDVNGDGIADIDADRDGLIDISTLQQLNAIRYQLDGRGYRESAEAELNTSGCPVAIKNGRPTRSCIGYELLNDLDFDEDHSGDFDSADSFWNQGNGWDPIGGDKQHFSAIFDGNGFTINYLMFSGFNSKGLFNSSYDADIRNLNLTTSKNRSRSNTPYHGAILVGKALLTRISDVSVSGIANFRSGAAIAATADYCQLNRVRFHGDLVSSWSNRTGVFAGLVGKLKNSAITNSYSTGKLHKENTAYGISYDVENSTIANSYTTMRQLGSGHDIQTKAIPAQDLPDNTLTSSYWLTNRFSASDLTQREIQDNSFGLTLDLMMCFQGNKDDSDCPASLSLDLFKDWKTTDWLFGDNNQLPQLTPTNHILDSDGDGSVNTEDDHLNDYDNDGVTDSVDVFPTINIGDLADGDNDGAPDECDFTCRQTGMSADDDSDNDGVPDDKDAYPHIALGNLPDSDGDGRPNECNYSCERKGMRADTDDDNDEIPDIRDDFPTNPAASRDSDNDGRPDFWLSSCDSVCREKSGLTLDLHTSDKDNDGVKDSDDPDNNRDNGLPEMLTVADTMWAKVNTEDGNTLRVPQVVIDSLVSFASATDVVDSSDKLTIKVSNNGQNIILEEGKFILQPGLHSLLWQAEDSSGNISAGLIQDVYVYPEVRFALAQSRLAEPGTIAVEIELSGTSPEYPVHIPVTALTQSSTVNQDDIDHAFDLEESYILTLHQGQESTPTTSGTFNITAIEDFIDEPDEVLTLVIPTKPVSIGPADYGFVLRESGRSHRLIIGEGNQPPTVSITASQAGISTNEINTNGGMVTLTANIKDPNQFDEHSVSWNLGGMKSGRYRGKEVTFSPGDIVIGDYSISVTVHDNGKPVMSATASKSIKVNATDNAPPGNNIDNSGSGGGGAIHLWYLMMLFIGVYGLRRRRR